MTKCKAITIAAIAFVCTAATHADIIEVGDLNIINDPGNPSDGLRFLDMTHSVGKTAAAALSAAQAVYPDTRLATPSEWDDLFAAAGMPAADLDYPASAAFETGQPVSLMQGNPNMAPLIDILGPTSGTDDIYIWSDPDGSADSATTRDHLNLGKWNGGAAFAWQAVELPPIGVAGWLLVSPVPEPATLSLLALGGLALIRRRP